MPVRKPVDFFWLFARFFLGLVFTYAGFIKLTEPIENFRGAVAMYAIIPYSLIPLIAAVMPWIEIIFGVFLMVGYLPRLSALVVSLLSLSFIVLILASGALWDPTAKDCGCFGQNGLIRLSVPQVFVLDCIDFVLGLLLFLVKEFPWSVDAVLKQELRSRKQEKT